MVYDRKTDRRTDSEFLEIRARKAPIHVKLRCNGVAEQRTAHLGCSGSRHEALDNLSGLLSFCSELGWLECSGGEPHERQPANQARREAHEQKKNTRNPRGVLMICF
ncbi:jg17210 [Pararge aegeria aegeria]|uniref:Jg17210 protein n=1 Tax=Pararge aegeria aegeria TaxID=348720 RepID=A0A8S4S9N5_9NEOP|nr:jg17210 [Pararge aegeria aegeria]